jgi:signal transduction histidine kinase
MLVIPLILMLLTALLLVVAFRGDLQSLKSLYFSKAESYESEDVYRLIRHTMSQNPELFAEPGYLNEIGVEMKKANSYIAVRLNDRIIFQSDLLRQFPEATGHLSPFHHAEYRDEEPPVRFGNDMYVLTQFDFTSGAKRNGSLFVWSKVDPLSYFARKFFPILFTALLVTLVLTHSLLTYLMSKSIIRPLRAMKKAVKQIQGGNLDTAVGVAGKDEIGQLGVAFEDMRVQLQQSILLQLQYEENRKELISNISHDLKTPITAIKGYVDGLLDGVADTPQKARKYMKTIAAKAEEMDHLIDELFLYSKLDLKRLPFAFEPVGIFGFMIDWAEEMQFELEKKGVRMETRISAESETIVMLDRDQFKRVLVNVMENSVNYMNKDMKLIRIGMTENEAAVVIDIADNGRGIAPDALPHIFERFYRAEQSRNANTGGSGLGLAIARQIMEGHGGEIRAESVEGEGTLIQLALPILKEGQAE